jgi:hypothetical protein
VKDVLKQQMMTGALIMKMFAKGLEGGVIMIKSSIGLKRAGFDDMAVNIALDKARAELRQKFIGVALPLFNRSVVGEMIKSLEWLAENYHRLGLQKMCALSR